jgi:hypothetical protein
MGAGAPTIYYIDPPMDGYNYITVDLQLSRSDMPGILLSNSAGDPTLKKLIYLLVKCPCNATGQQNLFLLKIILFTS